MCELCAKAVAANVRHAILFGQGRHGGSLIIFVEGMPKKDKVCKPSSDIEIGFHEGIEV